MPGIELIRSFLQQATAHGSRSTALNPLAWILGVALSAALTAIWLHAQTIVIGFLLVFAAVILLVFLFAYVYLLFNDRDALRSEKFTLSKLAIEKSVLGDSVIGFLEGQSADRRPEIVPVASGGTEAK